MVLFSAGLNWNNRHVKPGSNVCLFERFHLKYEPNSEMYG